jgi:hypothetical protein
MRALLLSLALLAGCRGDRDQCEAACRNAFTQRYWRTADKDVAAAPEKDRAALRKRRLGEFDSKLENGVELCINQCTSANNEPMNKCLIEAKSGSAVDDCLKE